MKDSRQIIRRGQCIRGRSRGKALLLSTVLGAGTVVLLALGGCGGGDDCARLCEAWPEATSGQADCARILLKRRGFDVDGPPACVGAVTEKQCLGCAGVLETPPETCAEVYETCFLGQGLPAEVVSVTVRGGEGSSEEIEPGEISRGSVSVGREGIRIEGGGPGGGTVEVGKGGVVVRGGNQGQAPSQGPPQRTLAKPAPEEAAPQQAAPPKPAGEDFELIRCPTNEDCSAGKNARFRLECAGSNCNLLCGEGSDCIVACVSNCDIEGARDSHLEVSCGANCDVTCAPGAVCVVDCAGGNCRCEGPGCRRAG